MFFNVNFSAYVYKLMIQLKQNKCNNRFGAKIFVFEKISCLSVHLGKNYATPNIFQIIKFYFM